MLRSVLVGVCVVCGLSVLVRLALLLTQPFVVGRDFIVVYLLVHALVDGLNPNLPVPVLARHYGFPAHLIVYHHPTPHPPTMGLLLFPLAWLDQVTAGVLWFFLSIGWLMLAVTLLLRLVNIRHSLLAALALSLTLVVWQPVAVELFQGQVMLGMLAALAGMLLILRASHHFLAGLLLALTLLLKPIVWPVLLLLVFRREWQFVGAAAVGTVLGYSVAAVVTGPERLVVYFTQTLPAVALWYRGILTNISLTSVGVRLFEGYPPLPGFPASDIIIPLVASPVAAQTSSVGLPLAVLVVGFLLSRGLALDRAIGVMVCVSIVVSPVAWVHYLVLTLIPVTQVLATLSAKGWPARDTNVSLLLLTILVVPLDLWAGLATYVSGPLAERSPSQLAAIPSLVMVMPSVSVLALAWLAARLGRRYRITQIHPQANMLSETSGRASGASAAELVNAGGAT